MTDHEPVTVTGTMPNHPSGPFYLTSEAVASLIGQEARLTARFNHDRPAAQGRAKVLDARIVRDDVHLTFEAAILPEYADLFEWKPEPGEVSLPLLPHVGIGGRRVSDCHVQLREIAGLGFEDPAPAVRAE